MMQNIGDEGHFLGADYTRENLAFIPHLQDNETHETWALNGSKTAYDRGLEAARNLLDRYEDVEPTLDRGVDDGLREFVTKREAAFAKRS